MVNATSYIVIAIDVIGILIGLYCIYYIYSAKKIFRGRAQSALDMFVWGVLFMIVAFGMTLVFSRLELFPPLPIDVHHLFMTVGMVLFVMSAKKFTSILSDIKSPEDIAPTPEEKSPLAKTVEQSQASNTDNNSKTPPSQPPQNPPSNF